MTGMTAGRLEARSAFAEIDFARDPCADHPLERSVDGGAADSGRFFVDARDQIVGAEVPLLTEKHLNDAIALGRSFAAGRNRGSR